MDKVSQAVVSSALTGDIREFLQKHKERVFRDLIQCEATLEQLLVIKGEALQIHRMESDFRDKKAQEKR